MRCVRSAKLSESEISRTSNFAFRTPKNQQNSHNFKLNSPTASFCCCLPRSRFQMRCDFIWLPRARRAARRNKSETKLIHKLLNLYQRRNSARNRKHKQKLFHPTRRVGWASGEKSAEPRLTNVKGKSSVSLSWVAATRNISWRSLKARSAVETRDLKNLGLEFYDAPSVRLDWLLTLRCSRQSNNIQIGNSISRRLLCSDDDDNDENFQNEFSEQHANVNWLHHVARHCRNLHARARVMLIWSPLLVSCCSAYSQPHLHKLIPWLTSETFVESNAAVEPDRESQRPTQDGARDLCV